MPGCKLCCCLKQQSPELIHQQVPRCLDVVFAEFEDVRVTGGQLGCSQGRHAEGTLQGLQFGLCVCVFMCVHECAGMCSPLCMCVCARACVCVYVCFMCVGHLCVSGFTWCCVWNGRRESDLHDCRCRDTCIYTYI
jgi:hypothetical protein